MTLVPLHAMRRSGRTVPLLLIALLVAAPMLGGCGDPKSISRADGRRLASLQEGAVFNYTPEGATDLGPPIETKDPGSGYVLDHSTNKSSLTVTRTYTTTVEPRELAVAYAREMLANDGTNISVHCGPEGTLVIGALPSKHFWHRVSVSFGPTVTVSARAPGQGDANPLPGHHLNIYCPDITESEVRA